MSVGEVSLNQLFAAYDVFLLDAYGVLVSTGGALEGGKELLLRLQAEHKTHLLLSNDASRSPATTVERYQRFGLEIKEDQILTSGMLIAPYFRKEGLSGANCIVLGTDDSRAFVTDAGGTLVDLDDPAVEVVVVADDEGYPFLRGIERTITTLCKRLDRGGDVRLVLPNPDLIYPRTETDYGLTAGSVALLIESALHVRYGTHAPRFVPLGKPHRWIFDVAFERLGLSDRARTVMLGDQLRTDIEGACGAGIDSVLLMTGLTRPGTDLSTAAVRPTYVLQSLVDEAG
jgi:HAD superfamily hydrolase (TIGR01450 family)